MRCRLLLLSTLLLLPFSMRVFAEDFLLLDDVGGVEMHFSILSYTGHDEFSLGNFDNSWDSSKRYELAFAVSDYWRSQRGYYGSFYMFWEEREWVRPGQFVDTWAFGAGYEFGGRFWVLKPRDNPPLNFAIAPYGRIGFALQDVDFDNIQVGGNSIDGSVDVERLEFFAGVDLIMDIMERGHASLGIGAQFWMSDQVAGDVNGNPVSTESFNGDSVFVRLSLALQF